MKHLTDKKTITFAEFMTLLKAYPMFDELDLLVTKTYGGYRIHIMGKDRISYKEEGASVILFTMHTDPEGCINFIEHGYQVFTKDNKQYAIYTARFIGKKIADIGNHVNS